MKFFISVIILVACALAAPASAQSVLVTPKKVTYKRPQPTSEYKKNFTITYPKVKASTPALSKKIETTLSYAKVLDLNLKEELGEYQWLEEADYEVGYNKKGLLTIKLFMFGSAAYPDGSSKTLVVDLKTGNRVRPADLFTNLPGLAAMIRKTQSAEVVQATKEIAADPENKDIDPKEFFEGKNFSVKNLDEFAINDSGVTFIYDYNFPHVVQALQPDGEYTYSWQKLKPYIKRGGLLAKFVR